MSERIARSIRAEPTGSHLFAVGAAHLSGKDGMIELLEKAGFDVTRVEGYAGDSAMIQLPEVPFVDSLE